MNNNAEKQSVLKSLAKNLIALAIFFAIPFLAYRSCTSGYDKYAYYVRATDEAIFTDRLNPSDARILDRGRRLTEEMVVKDKDIDNGNGKNAGKFRWYACSGIDCDEGWKISFSARK